MIFSNRHFHLALLAALGLVSRLFFSFRNVAAKGDLYSQPVISEKTYDSGQYVILARNLRYHHVFSLAQTPDLTPTYFRPPGYPVFLSLWLHDGALSLYALCFAQAILGTLTVVLVYLLAQARFDRKVALVAGLFMALAPRSSVWAGEIWTETLYTFLIILGVFLFEKSHYALSGFAYGLSWLVRPTTMLFLPFVLLACYVFPALRKRKKGALLMTAIAVLTITPWTLRNAVVFGKFIPVAIAGGRINLLFGTYEMQLGQSIWMQVLKEPTAISPYAWDDPRSEEIYFQRAVERITAHPLRWLWARAKQYPRLLLETGWYLRPENPALAKIVTGFFIVGSLLFWVLAFYGLLLERVSNLTLFPIFLLLFHLPLWVEGRYSLPMIPMATILVALALRHLAGKFSLTASLIAICICV